MSRADPADQATEPLPRAVAEALVARHGGRIERRGISIPAEVEHVPDYSCDPRKAGDHGRCQFRVHYPDWQFDCSCYQVTPHTRFGNVLIVPLAEEGA